MLEQRRVEMTGNGELVAEHAGWIDPRGGAARVVVRSAETGDQCRQSRVPIEQARDGLEQGGAIDPLGEASGAVDRFEQLVAQQSLQHRAIDPRASGQQLAAIGRADIGAGGDRLCVTEGGETTDIDRLVERHREPSGRR
ncbi:MAG: hypothetical protein J7D61_16310 [Marichromatium sp.]|nr:hypothetical protein [Marichromatium sp.]